jgi:2',3'-cyclic-nucleotide 2'-phosphodiesterase/3'-nucleotidase
VVFSSGVGVLAQATAGGVAGVTLVAADDGSGKNLSKYKIDLNQ